MHTTPEDRAEAQRAFYANLTPGQRLMYEHGLTVVPLTHGAAVAEATLRHARRLEGPTLVSVRYHRNGTNGEGHYVVLFDADVDGDRRILAGILNDTPETTRAEWEEIAWTHVLVIDLEDPLNTLRGADTWGRWVVEQVGNAVEDGSAYIA